MGGGGGSGCGGGVGCGQKFSFIIITIINNIIVIIIIMIINIIIINIIISVIVTNIIDHFPNNVMDSLPVGTFGGVAYTTIYTSGNICPTFSRKCCKYPTRGNIRSTTIPVETIGPQNLTRRNIRLRLSCGTPAERGA